MNQLDLYYRAFYEYRRLTLSDKECARQRNVISHSNPDADKLEATKFFCIIKEDWISEIEKGLVFVEKAINEERQFIRNDGEVVPIEKAKHVDKHSVEHLSRHSEYITRLPEDGSDIVPDKLYMIERDSDFAVYENRFLYMLLRYLAEFIDVRLGRITELGNTYRASTQMKKSISLGKRHITYEARLTEDRANDPYTFLNSEARELIGRIEGIEHWVNALLGTPLMEQVAKVPMVRPPITKTNVLRMNNNFKNAVALYEYVTSYEGDGYTIEERNKVYSPFTDAMADDFSELVLLTSFLTYEYGNDIKSELKESFEREELRLREKEKEKLASQISALKKRIVEMGESPESYMLLLEKRNNMLEADSQMLKRRNEENEELKTQIKGLESDVAAAEQRISTLSNGLAEANHHIDELNDKYERDMNSLKEAHAKELERLNAEHTARLKEAEGQFEERLRSAASERAASEARLRSEFSAKETELVEKSNGEIANYRSENERLSKERTLARAELNALRQKHGLTSDLEDFSSKERFEELEREYAAFVELFEKEWKKTKKKIRKEILWTVNSSDSDGNKEGRT